MKKVCIQALMTGLAVGFLSATPAQGQTTRYVVAGNPGAFSPYTNLTEASATIQAAVDVSVAGDIILVEPGTYDSGGKAASGSSLTNRVMVPVALTIRASSADRSATIIRGRWHEGFPGGPTTNRCGDAAVRGVWLANNARIQGFTIEGGATRTAAVSSEIGADHCSGGVYCAGPASQVSNCLIQANTAFSKGAAIYQGLVVDSIVSGNAQPLRETGLASQTTEGGGGGYGTTFVRCKVWGNYAWNNGGGGYNCVFEHSVVSNNVVANNGGGMHTGSATNTVIVGNNARYGGGTDWSILRQCQVLNNTSPWVGGASSSTLYGCLVSGNTGSSEGGGISGGKAYRSVITNNTGTTGGARAATLYNCHVLANAGGNVSGGMYLCTAYNTLIVGNRVTGYYGAGGGARESTLYNCTVVGNQANDGGGGVFKGNAYNSIVVGNVSTRNGDNYDALAVFHTSCSLPAKDGWSEGNIAVDPRFIDPGSGTGSGHVFGDYRLDPHSRCVDKGQAFDWMTAPTFAGDIRLYDLDGEPRIQPTINGAVDMGSFETLPLPRGTVVTVK